MNFYEVVNNNGEIHIYPKKVDRRLIKGKLNISVNDKDYEKLCQEDRRYYFANFVLTLNDETKIFGR